MPRYKSKGNPPGLPRRTCDYLAHGAPEGTRNAELFDAACQMRDAGQSAGEIEDRLIARALADGLSESEARQTIQSVFARAPREPLRCAPNHNGANGNGLSPAAPPRTLPAPVEDGFTKLLDACFEPDEFVAIAPATINDEGEVVPRRGNTHTVRELKEKIAAKGSIDKLFKTKRGLWLRINPMCRNGAGNKDVTVLRHVLVEFDQDGEGKLIPKQEQWRVIAESGLPISAVIDSGNKSLHAWVRVDAPDQKEYRRRVEAIWKLFEKHHLDRQNRNPSRLSRCPDGWRTVDGERRRQALLATGLGAASWSEWESQQSLPDDEDRMPIAQLAVYDTSNDPNNVLGDRWLCRGGSLVIVGQSGVGKSSLCMQLMILWALGRPAFNVAPIGPLRSLLIQAENDIGDLAEMYQGVREGMELTPEEEALLDERITIYRDTTRTGEEFVSAAAALVDRHKPDLVWADPLLNYIGDDISEQRVISEFCCQQLNRVSLRTGVIWCLLHHTGKPSKDPKASTHWTASDLAYSGIGSSALTNWARETAVLVRVKTSEGIPPTFQLSMTKRRLRAGLLSTAGEPTDSIFLRHSDRGGICWEQCEVPIEKPSTTYKRGRKSAFDPGQFQAVLDQFGGSLTANNESEVAEALSVSPRTAWRWHKRLKNRGSDTTDKSLQQ